MAKNLVDQLMEALPELTEIPNVFHPNSIHLQNDSDGAGDFIAAWNYSKPLPAGFKIGK